VGAGFSPRRRIVLAVSAFALAASAERPAAAEGRLKLDLDIPLTTVAAHPQKFHPRLMLRTEQRFRDQGLVYFKLFAGIVVKNSILLIDFIAAAKERGESTYDALIGSVRIRTRPILMTAVGTSVGMIPIAMEWAIGLERLSPLAIVAIGGLMVSTFLTMVYVPILYSLFEDLQHWATGLMRRARPQVQEG